MSTNIAGSLCLLASLCMPGGFVQAQDHPQNPFENVDLHVFNLGPGINTPFSEYNPVLNPQGSLMLYTSRSDSATGAKIYPDDRQFFEDINLASIKEGVFRPASAEESNLWFSAEAVNTDRHEAPVAFSQSDERIIIFKSNELWYSDKTDDGYSEPRPFPKNINFSYLHRHASLSADGNTMYFTAEVLDKVLNRFHLDLFVVQRDEAGEWGKPTPLPAPINSPYDEDSPEVSPDGKSLYFSSNRSGGLGGYDVYVAPLVPAPSEQDGMTDDASPVSPTLYWLPTPINSAAQDIYFKPLRDGETAYFCSNRLGGFGGMDIYKVAFLVPKTDDCPALTESTSLKVSGEDTVLQHTPLLLRDAGSRIDGKKLDIHYWYLNGQRHSTTNRLEKLITESGEVNVLMVGAIIDSAARTYRQACVTFPAYIVRQMTFERLMRENPLITFTTTQSDVDAMARLPRPSGALELSNDLVRTTKLSPVEINVLDNDRAARDGQIRVVAVGRSWHGNSLLLDEKRGVVRYHPALDFSGFDHFWYDVEDAQGQRASAWVVVRIEDEEQIFAGQLLRNDRFVTQVNTPIEINVLANDMKGVGLRLSVQSFGPSHSGSFSAVDLSNGTLIYQPNQDFEGKDLFEYAVADPAGRLNRALVEVIVGEAPTMTRPDLVSTFVEQMVSIPVFENDDVAKHGEAHLISVTKPLNGAVQIFDAEKGVILFMPQAGFTGVTTFFYVLQAPSGVVYREGVTVSVKSEAPVLIAGTEEKQGEKVVAASNTGSDVVLVEVDPNKVNTDVKPALEFKPIYFDFDKAYVRSDARSVMDENIRLLLANPDVVIEIVSHCDARGSREYNLLLSSRRAKATMEYLVAQGVSRDRIVASVGMGEDQLVNECGDGVPCSKADHQRNRRSDFIVVGTMR